MQEFEPIDVVFLINSEEVKKDSEKVKSSIRGIADDAESTTARVNKQVSGLFKGSSSEIDKGTAALGRQKREYDGLGNSLAQITRELPAFTFSAQTGFLAISNNIPILADEIARLKANNAELVASGQKGKSVFGQVAKSFLSWNTVLSVGVTLLTIYGPQLFKFVQSLFDSKKAIDDNKKSLEALNKAYESSSYQKAVRGVTEVRAAFAGAGTDINKKEVALKLYNKTLGDALGTANNYNAAERLFREKSDAYVRALLFRAAATEAVNEASKELIRLTKEEDEVQRGIDERGGTTTATSTFATKRLRENRAELQKEAKAVETSYNRIINRLNGKADQLAAAFNLDLDNGDTGGNTATLNKRKSLLQKIADLDSEYARKRLDNNAAELKALQDKFAKIRRLVDDFNADPKNAKVQIDSTDIDRIEQSAIDTLTFTQSTENLKTELATQKQFFREFEEFKKQFGIAKAKERFSEELKEFESYAAFLQQAYKDNAPAFDAFVEGNATGPQLDRVNLIIAAAEEEKRVQAQTYNDLLEELQNYEQQRTRLLTDYEAERKKLVANGDIQAAEQLKRNLDAELSDLDEGYAKGTEEYKRLIQGVEDVSTLAARTVIANARKMVNALVEAGRLTADTAREINQQIDKLEQDVDNRSAEGLSQVSGQLGQLAGAFLQLGDSLEEYDEGLADTITTLGELTQVASDAAQAGASFASGDIVGGVASGISAIAGLFSIGARARQSQREAEAELLNIQNRIADGEIRLNEIQRARNIAKAEEIELTLKGIAAQRKALAIAQQQIKADEQLLLNQLQQEQFITGSRTERFGGFLGIGRKTRVVNDYEQLLGKTFEEIEALHESGKLTDRANELFEQLRRVREEGQDVNGLLGDLEQAANEIFTGTTSGAIADSIITGLKEGKRSFEDFGGDIEGILQDAILSGIQYNVLEEPLQRLYEDFAAFAESEGELTESEANAIRQQYQDQVQRAIDQYEQFSGVLDEDLLAGNQVQTGLQGAIRRELTEATASELTGLFRGQFDITKQHFQLDQQRMELDQRYYQQSLQALGFNAQIANNTEATVQTLLTVITELKNITKNTKQSQTARDLGK